ncbi:hypothetical protein ACLB2K_020808 [Fragaria x ananassa]
MLRVLQAFGFCDRFITFIHNILKSAHLSICVNGETNGYFTCSQGVRQGDPLSPLLFCLAEDVLSRGITLLSYQGKIDRFATQFGVHPPMYVLFTDDVMVFLQGRKKHLRALMHFLDEYALNSGQVLSKEKSTFFIGSSHACRQEEIQNVLGIDRGSLPFKYLGVPIFIGRPKPEFLLPIAADKVRCKLNSWKGSLLSQASIL